MFLLIYFVYWYCILLGVNKVVVVFVVVVVKSECPEKSNIERQISKSLKLWLLVVHIELFIAVWFICQMVFCFGRK